MRKPVPEHQTFVEGKLVFYESLGMLVCINLLASTLIMLTPHSHDHKTV